MNNLREVKDWLLFRKDELSSLTCNEDRKHLVNFDEISENILRNIPKRNKIYVQRQLNKLDDSFLDYLGYWNEKHYRNGFCDGIQLFTGTLNS